ncbi:hypothetical protein HNR25_003991 [Streptomonospora salina]|uniref:Uncharacterized protein n=1 Tax=Streptomonospora salina TaxID=104205 RepID=A0A841EIQ8_9ACTN|nr:hypothetical protein [Streptomonospora salina]
MVGRPATGQAPTQHVRAENDLWYGAKDRAERQFGPRTFPWLVRTLLEAYNRGELVIDAEGRVSVVQEGEDDADG